MKKGFSLIELMAVIVVLGLISVIVVPAVDRFIRNSQQSAYDAQIDNIIDGAKNWAADNYTSLPANNGESITINLGQLKTGKYVREDIVNPKTDELFSNNLLITITNKNNNYTYTVSNAY